MRKYLLSLEELDTLIKDVVENFSSGVIILRGDLAAGKTTFVKRAVKYLGIDDEVTSVETEHTSTVPEDFNLAQNFPNPFNPVTTISFSLAAPSHVRLVVYNVTGSQVRELVNNRHNAGSYQLLWDGRDDYNRKVSSGIYFYRLYASGQSGESISSTRKMMLLK